MIDFEKEIFEALLYGFLFLFVTEKKFEKKSVKN